jgi:hypothetical protein
MGQIVLLFLMMKINDQWRCRIVTLIFELAREHLVITSKISLLYPHHTFHYLNFNHFSDFYKSHFGKYGNTEHYSGNTKRKNRKKMFWTLKREGPMDPVLFIGLSVTRDFDIPTGPKDHFFVFGSLSDISYPSYRVHF